MKKTGPKELLIRGQLFNSGVIADIIVRGNIVRNVSIKRRLGQPDLGSEETLLGPSMIDMQINGGFGVDLQNDNFTIDDVAKLSQKLAANGIGRWLPTLVTAPTSSLCTRAARIAEAMHKIPLVRQMVPGLHLEGPFISPNDGPRGAHPKDHVIPPSLKIYKDIEKAAHGRIACITLAPEQPGAMSLIKALVRRNVLVALGHHEASAKDIANAVDAGAGLCTHLGNGLSNMVNRHINPLWPQLAEDRLAASFIADLHHLPAEMLKSMVWAKSPENSVLVSDAVSLAGLPPGQYDLFGAKVEKGANGRICLVGTEYLAGSGTLLLEGVINLWLVAELTMDVAFACVHANPARLLGTKPSVWPPSVGRRAEFIGFHLESVGKRVTPRIEFSFVGGNWYPPE